MTGPSSYINTTRLAVYQTHMTGTSVKNMVHFAQIFISGKFQMYDYGSNRQNLIYHNQTTPPLYDLKNIQTPVALYWGKHISLFHHIVFFLNLKSFIGIIL